MKEIDWRDATEATDGLRDWLHSASAKMRVEQLAAIEKVSVMSSALSQKGVVSCSTILLDGRVAVLVLLDGGSPHGAFSSIPDDVEGTQVRCCFVEGSANGK